MLHPDHPADSPPVAAAIPPDPAQAAQLEAQLQRLRAIIAGYGPSLVAFSGGVDSALVLAVAAEVLGTAVVCLTAVSETMAAREITAAAELAASLGVRHEQVRSHELARPGFAENPSNRCYHCKSELFDLCEPVAARLGLPNILLGTNLDDLSDHRPGLQAARERGARQPLVEAGLNKADVRRLAQRLGLSVWDKPQLACLSSRFPYGTRITEGRLRKVDQLEGALHDLGFSQLRVRFHEVSRPEGNDATAPRSLDELPALARLELPVSEGARVLSERAAIVKQAKQAGFLYVSLDLEGFRSGSGNAVLTQISSRPSRTVAESPPPASVAPPVAVPPPAAAPPVAAARPRKLVVAGLCRNAAGQVFISQRRADQAMPLLWEFPGGKIEPGELPEEALRRELEEELGVVASIGPIFEVIAHRYPEFDLLMLVYSCTFDREPVAKEVAQVRWVEPADLPSFPILPADAPLVARLAAVG